jgi:hypothetical protein
MMTSNKDKISLFQACFILVASAGIFDHVMVIPILLQEAGRDAWVSVLSTFFPFVAWIFLLVYIIRKTGQQRLSTWLQQHAGTGVSRIFSFLAALQLFSMAAVTLRDTTVWTNVTYLPKTPNLLLIIQHRIRSTVTAGAMILTCVVYANLILSPLTGAIAEFGASEAAALRFTAFEEWRLVTFGHYLEHVDFLSVYQWLVGSIIRISFLLFLIPEVFQLPAGKMRTILLLTVSAAIVAVTQIPISDMKFVQFLKNIFLPVSLALAIVLLVFLTSVTIFVPSRKVMKR